MRLEAEAGVMQFLNQGLPVPESTVREKLRKDIEQIRS